MNRLGQWILIVCLLVGCRSVPRWSASPPPLQFPDDTFAFANETVFAYRDGEIVSETELGVDRAADRYSRSCFVMARAAVQFWKYARFEADAPAVDDAALARRVRLIAHRAPWGRPALPDERIVIPGYANLRAFSMAKPRLLQEHLGSGLATYFRVGNWSMPFAPNRRHQAATCTILDGYLDQGLPAVVWLVNFPSVNINHVVVVLDRTTDSRGVRYRVYDPNFTDRLRTLRYDAARRTFEYEPTFYFVGGPVNVRVIYQNVVQ